MQQIKQPTRIRLFAATGIDKTLARYGVKPATVFMQANIPSSMLSDPYLEISFADFLRLLNIAAEVTGDPAFGLEYASQFDLNDLGPIIYAFRHCGTLGEALDLFTEHFQTLQQQGLYRVIETTKGFEIEYSVEEYDPELLRQDTEHSILLHIRTLRLFLGAHWLPSSISFMHKKPPNAGFYENYLSTEIIFEQRTNSISLNQTDLVVRGPNPDPRLVSIISSHLHSLPKAGEAKTNIEIMVRSYLARALTNSEPIDQQSLCQHFGLTARTLRNRLSSGNTGFQTIMIEERMREAKHLMCSTDYSIERIALALQYSEISAFSRSFKKHCKTSPLNFRKKLVG